MSGQDGGRADSASVTIFGDLALDILRWLDPDPTAWYDFHAMAFYRETGTWPNGKAAPMEMGERTDEQRRAADEKWTAWCAARRERIHGELYGCCEAWGVEPDEEARIRARTLFQVAAFNAGKGPAPTR